MEYFWITLYLLATLIFMAYGVHRLYFLYLYVFKIDKKDVPAGKKFSKLPSVTVQLPIYNEYYVVERLIEKTAELNYPPELLQIQVLDDSTDETCARAKRAVSKLKKQGVDIEYIHRAERTGYKAGALHNGMKSAKGEFILFLDADFVPPADLIMRLIHQFTDEKVAVVQARWGHLNKGKNLLTYLQAIMLDAHFILENFVRFKTGRFFGFNGTAGIWRKSAIVDAGGWHTDTLTEDLDLSYRAQLRGWKLVLCKDVVASAELPEDIFSFKAQQHRWSKGIVQNLQKNVGKVLWSDLPLYVKVEAVIHHTAILIYLVIFVVCALALPTAKAGLMFVDEAPVVTWITLALSSFSHCIFYFASQIIVGRKNILESLLILPILLAFYCGISILHSIAIIEGFFKKGAEFVRTPKRGDASASQKKFKYSAFKSYSFIIEFLMAGYFLYVWQFDYTNGLVTASFFVALSALGFFYIGTLSLFSFFNKSSIFNFGEKLLSKKSNASQLAKKQKEQTAN